MICHYICYVYRSCEDDVTYSYAVQVNVLGEHSELSPPVTFRLGQTFCGDGVVQVSVRKYG